jgi:hypothetical protein
MEKAWTIFRQYTAFWNMSDKMALLQRGKIKLLHLSDKTIVLAADNK